MGSAGFRCLSPLSAGGLGLDRPGEMRREVIAAPQLPSLLFFADPMRWTGMDSWPVPKLISGLLPTIFSPYSFHL